MDSRIKSLDVLRGVAMLGILVVNIQVFAFPSAVRSNPTVYGDFQGVNRWLWLASYALAHGKFVLIFGMLLGVSILLLQGGGGDRAAPAWRIHVLRMAALLGLGLAHAYLLFYDDMLVPLALCGTLVFFARRLSPRQLLVLGGLLLAAGSLVLFAIWWNLVYGPGSKLTAWQNYYPSPARVNVEIKQYLGSWAEQMRHRVPAARAIQTIHMYSYLFWQMTGVMLLGMAFYRLGVLTGARSRAFYLRMAAAGFGGGALLIGLALWRSFATNWAMLDWVLVGQQLHYWGNLLVALGWIALVMLLCQRGWQLRPVAAVGRMALSNYLLATFICTTLFYGHGFGLFGQVDRAGLLLIVLAIWAFQLLASSAWLRWFALGPVEWGLRWIIYGRRPGFLRSTSAAVQP